MAENSLDDFFAKKDKSKKSKGKKFTTSSDLSKKVEPPRKPGNPTEKVIRKEKEKSTTSAVSTAQNPEEEDDEWREIEEKEVDLSGLKIQNLQISEYKDDDQDKDRSDSHSEDGDSSRGKDGMSGPWNKNTPTPVPKQQEVEKKETAPAKYQNPHSRNAAKTLRSSKTAPEIGSESDFPSLSAALEPPKPTKKPGFETSRGYEMSKRPYRHNEEQHPNRGLKIDLGNRYDSLSHGDTS